MRLLAVVASKHGSTWEVGEAVADELRAAGHDVDLAAPAEAPEPDGYDALVLGSATYMMRWMNALNAWVEGHAEAVARTPHAVFSVGLAGGQAVLADALHPRSERTFAGKLDLEALSQVERTAVTEGESADFRDFETIRAWARTLPEVLTD